MAYFYPEHRLPPELRVAGTEMERAVLRRYGDHLYPGVPRPGDRRPEPVTVETERQRQQALLGELERVSSGKRTTDCVNMVIQGASMTPYEIYDDLAAVLPDVLHATGGRPLRIRHLTQMTPGGAEPAYLSEGYQYGVIAQPWFVSPPLRRAVAEGRAAYEPAPLETIGRLLEIGESPADIVVFQCTHDPDNPFGYVSMGSSCDVALPAVMQALQRRQDGEETSLFAYENAQGVIAYGATAVHRKDINIRCPIDRPLMTSERAKPDPTSIQIARNIMNSGFILDGSIIQLGIGGVPEAVATLIAEGEIPLEDLAASTELLGDGHLMLHRSGMLTNRFRPDFPGKTLYSFANGSAEVLAAIHLNPDFMALPSTVINSSIFKVQSHAPFISINGALEVGLDGANSESPQLGSIHSGRGGAGDFTRIGRMFGHAILALPSTWVDKSGPTPVVRSRIVPFLNGPTSIAAAELDLVATEEGIAELKMKSMKARAIALMGLIGRNRMSLKGDILREAARHPMFRIG